MVTEWSRWLRGVLVLQLVIAWPCAGLLWLGGGTMRLAVAVGLLWISALACVAGIVVPNWHDEHGLSEAWNDPYVPGSRQV